MIKVGNQTNSQDPQAVNSRVFVGNLNTFQATKTDVERLFQRYGRIAGISMHKGFAFIQFTNPFDARSACMGEDARSIFGQVLDVNMVAEPKPAQTGRKRQQQQQQKQQQLQQQQQQQHQHNVMHGANDWYYAAAAAAANPFTAAAAVRLAAVSPPNKRQRVMVPPLGAAVSSPGSGGSSTSDGQTPSPTPAAAAAPHRAPKTFCLDDLKTYSSPDILICGNCREMFGDVMDMLDHKRTYCKLRFACKCGEHTTTTTDSSRSSGSLVCALCKESFCSAWDLMVHFQTAHTVNIYRLGSPSKDADARSETAGSETGVRDAEVREVTSPGSAVLPNGASTAAAMEVTNGSPPRLSSPALKAAAAVADRVNGSAVAQRS